MKFFLKGTVNISETGEIINMSNLGILLSTTVKHTSNNLIYILLAVIAILLIIIIFLILSLLKKQSIIKFAYPKKSARRQLIKDYKNKVSAEKRIKENKKQQKKESKEQNQ